MGLFIGDRKLISQLLWCLCLSLLSAQGAVAWSGKGHAFIAESSVQGLGVQTQKSLIDVLEVGPWNSKKRYKSLESLVAQASKWPDWIKDKNLSEVFKQSGSGAVPAALRPYANRTTQNWHYVNAIFLSEARVVLDSTRLPRDNSCSVKNGGELFRVWPLLFEAYQQSGDRRDKAILLAFILHLGADAYQPLHVFSALDAQCEHDAGGNGYCIKPSKKRCRQNLHQLWDGGFGLFDGQLSMSNRERFNGDLNSLQGVLLKHRPFLERVYPESPSLVLNVDYQREALRAVTDLSGDSIARLFASLNHLESK